MEGGRSERSATSSHLDGNLSKARRNSRSKAVKSMLSWEDGWMDMDNQLKTF